MDWTDELIGKLRDLWAQGLPTAEIGRQLSISKNAVVGKAHRLKLPPRPSPIRARAVEGEAKTPATRKESVKKTGKPKSSLEEGKAARSKKTVSVSAGAENISAESAETGAPDDNAAPVMPAGSKKAETPQNAKEMPTASPTDNIMGKSVRAGEKKPEVVTKKTASSAKGKARAPASSARRLRDTLDPGTRQGPTCQWPTGNPGEPGFHFCGAVPIPGKPYCVEHAAIAYVKIRDKRE